MSRNSQNKSEISNYFIELAKPTEEDLKRVFSEEELKELCLKQKSKVDIWRWNIVNDYRVLFTQSGRYERWSENHRLHMLAKAVNKMKPSVLYDEEEIIRAKKEEWKFQLKENILALNFWKRQQLEQKTPITNTQEIDPELRFEIDTESLNTESEIMTNYELDLQSQMEVNNDSENYDKFNREFKKNYQVASTKFAQNVKENIIEANFEEDYFTDTESEDLIDSVLKDEQNKKPREILHSDEVAIEIQNIYDINTMSMTMDSELSSQSQDFSTLQSQSIVPQNYDNFKNVIPVTSTQSQMNGTEEIIV